MQRYRARKVEVRASPKLDVMADGVVLGKGTVEIKNRRGALWVIAPETAPALPAAEQGPGAELPAPVSPAGQDTYHEALQEQETLN